MRNLYLRQREKERFCWWTVSAGCLCKAIVNDVTNDVELLHFQAARWSSPWMAKSLPNSLPNCARASPVVVVCQALRPGDCRMSCPLKLVAHHENSNQTAEIETLRNTSIVSTRYKTRRYLSIDETCRLVTWHKVCDSLANCKRIISSRQAVKRVSPVKRIVGFRWLQVRANWQRAADFTQ